MPVELARIAIALGVVLFGFVLAHAVRALAMRIFRRASSQFALLSSGASEQAGLPRATEAMTRAQAAAIAGAGRVAFWLVFTLFLGAGTSLLGFPVISSWLASMAAYLPRVLASVAILLLGVLSGLFVRVVVTAATRTSSASMASPLGKAAQMSVVLLAAAMAIEQLGVQITLLVVLAAVVVGALLGGASLAFALGARGSVSNILACHYLSKWYRVGQTVRVDGQDGRIVQFLPGAVILQTELGKLYVPGEAFTQTPSLLLVDEESK